MIGGLCFVENATRVYGVLKLITVTTRTVRDRKTRRSNAEKREEIEEEEEEEEETTHNDELQRRRRAGCRTCI